MPDLRIGTDFTLDLDRFRDEGLRIGTFASSGAGKGYLVGVILEELIKDGYPCLMVDPEGELWTFREAGAFVVGGRHGHVPLPHLADPYVEELARDVVAFCIDTATPVVFDLDGLGGAEITDAFEVIAGAYWKRINEDRTPSVLAITEAHLVAPQTLPRGARAGVVLPRILSGGRKRGAITILETQRIAEIANTVIGHCNVRFLGRIDFEDDYRRVAKAMPKGVTYADVAALERGTFYVPRLADAPIHVRERRVTHGGGTPAGGGEVKIRPAAARQEQALAVLLERLSTQPDAEAPAAAQASRPPASHGTGRGGSRRRSARADDGPTTTALERAHDAEVARSAHLETALTAATAERDTFERLLDGETLRADLAAGEIRALRTALLPILDGAPLPEAAAAGVSGASGLDEAAIVALIRKHAPAAAAPALMPVEALRAKYLEASAQRLYDRVRSLDADEREALLFLIGQARLMTISAIAIALSSSNSGGGRDRWGKAVQSLEALGLVRSTSNGKAADVESGVVAYLSPHNPTDAEVAAVRDRALYLLQGGA